MLLHSECYFVFLPMFGDHQRISGLPSIPQPTEGRGLGYPTKSFQVCGVSPVLPKMNEANVMLPYSGKEELPR